MNVITIDEVSKDFGKVRALDNINIRFEAGKIYGLLGRNGAGKTTMIKIIYGMLFPSTGTITVNGKKVTDDDILGQMFFAGEKNYLLPDASVEKIFRIMKDFRPEFDAAYAKSLADSFGMDVKKKVRSLSTGYATLLKNILALASNASCLLLDEPTLGLDANHRDMFYRSLLEKYGAEPFTLIISTHSINEVAAIVDHVIVIHDGRIIKNESRDTLIDSGYTVSGKASAVREYTRDKEILGSETLGGYEVVFISGQPPIGATPDNVEIGKMDLQSLFIQLTNTKGRDRK